MQNIYIWCIKLNLARQISHLTISQITIHYLKCGEYGHGAKTCTLSVFLTALLTLCDNFIFLIFSIYSFTVKMSSHACTLQLFWTFNISGCCGTWFWLFREISWGNKVLLFPIHTKTTLPLYKTSEESMHVWLVSGVEEETMWRETHSSRSAHNLQIAAQAEIFKLSFKHCTKPCWSFSFVFDEL